MDNTKDFSVCVSGGPSNLTKAMIKAEESDQHMIIEAALNLPDEFELDDPTIKKLDSKKSRG
jgi:hypothetical protein